MGGNSSSTGVSSVVEYMESVEKSAVISCILIELPGCFMLRTSFHRNELFSDGGGGGGRAGGRSCVGGGFCGGRRSRPRTDADVARGRVALLGPNLEDDACVRLGAGLGGVRVTSLGMEEKRDSVHDDRSSWWNDKRGAVGRLGEVAVDPLAFVSVDGRAAAFPEPAGCARDGGRRKSSSA